MMIKKLKRNRSSATKTKFDLFVVAVNIPAIPRMKEISKGDLVNIAIERNGKIITQTEDTPASTNPRDHSISLQFKQEMSLVSTMYRDMSNSKYVEKKAKLLLRVKASSGKYSSVGDGDFHLDELATIYDNAVETVVTKNVSLKHCSVPGVSVTVRFNVSSIGKDEKYDTSLETDTIISDTTLDLEEVDFQDREGASNGTSCASGSSIAERYEEQRMQARKQCSGMLARANMKDYSRSSFRSETDVDFLRGENKSLQEEADKFKKQCGRLNEEIEHLNDRLGEAERKIERLSREKEVLAQRLCSAEAQECHSPPQRSFLQKLCCCGNKAPKPKRGSKTFNSVDGSFNSMKPEALNDDEEEADVQMLETEH